MTNKHYVQLDQKERDQIFRLKIKELTNTEIAAKLGRDTSTIGRELRRNMHQKLHQYLPDTAGRKASKRKERGRKVRYVVKDAARLQVAPWREDNPWPLEPGKPAEEG